MTAVGGYTPTPFTGTGSSGTTTASPNQVIGVPDQYQPPLSPAVAPPGSYDARIQAGTAAGPVSPANFGLRTSLGTQPSAHIYTENDVYAIAGEPPVKIKQIQETMVTAGLLDPATYTPGRWDVNSQTAYRTMLASANAYGANAADTLNALAAAPPLKQKGQRLPLALTNPLDIAQSFRGAAESMTGGSIGTSQQADFTSWYQAQEQQARNRYNAVDTSTQAGYLGAPAPGAAAEAYVLGHDQQAIRAYSTVQNALRFDQMLKAL